MEARSAAEHPEVRLLAESGKPLTRHFPELSIDLPARV